MKSYVLKTFLLLIVILIMAGGVSAELATDAEMNLVCQNWLSLVVYEKTHWAGSANPQISNIQKMIVNDTLLAHIYSIEPTGYVVVPALKALAPVKVTSEEYDLNVNDQGGMAALLREVFVDAHEAYVKYYGALETTMPKVDGEAFGREYRDRWDRYTLPHEQFEALLAQKDRDTMVEVGPLLSCHWHQGAPYNNFCPWGDGGRCVVGCVATAAAQIMDYHEWPPYGISYARQYWNGDESCGGSTNGMYITRNLDNNYDWANIPDHAGTGDAQEILDAVAELNHEVGVAYHMFYGRCGSGAYVFSGLDVYPEQFRYKDEVVRLDRTGHTKEQWFELVSQDIDDGLPINYRITGHAIVLDGYRVVDGNDQMHFNYGWNSSHSTWYTVDYLYCPWEGCSNADQMMLTRIIPDKDAYFLIDTLYGLVPLTVNVSGLSSLAVSSCDFDFGDGGTALTESAMHTYNEPGNYTITMNLETDDGPRTMVRENVIVAIADTMIAPHVVVAPDSVTIAEVYLRNSAPLDMIEIPINFAGATQLFLDSFSVEGCRTDYFESVVAINFAPNMRATIRLRASEYYTSPPLPPGAGPILRLYFSGGLDCDGQSVPIDLNGYSNYYPTLSSVMLEYEPDVVDGSLTGRSCCVDRRGNVNGDPEDQIDITDVLHLVNFMFNDGPDPGCWLEADLDASTEVDISDLIYLVNYMFNGSYPPLMCP